MTNDKAADRADVEDRYLGLATVDTWPQLGKLLSDRDDPAALRQWASDIKRNLSGSQAEAMVIDKLAEFAKNIFRLLERKHDGRDIAAEVQNLTKPAAKFRFIDEPKNKQYLRGEEPLDVFWALEYQYMFDELVEPTKGAGWLEHVAHCKDTECKKFFIKSRRNQEFCSEACRVRFGNREFYKKNKQAKAAVKGRSRRRRAR